MAERARRPHRPRSLRARITAGATAVVAAVLVIGALVFYGVLAASMHDAAARSAETRLDEAAARIEAGDLDWLDDLDDGLVQVLDEGGAVVAASEDAVHGLLPSGDDDGRAALYDDDPVLVVDTRLDDGRTVRFAASLDDERETLATVALLLVISVPVLAALVAGVTWGVVGRALRPVTRIRTEVDAITADRLDRRIDVPPSGDEIAALAVTMNRMLDRFDASAAAQRRFVSDASHELRSPLATIRQHAELAQAHPDATSTADLADVVHDEGLRMQGLVDALLLLARLDEQAPAGLEPIDLDDLALAEASRLRAAGLEVDGSGIGPGRVEGDPRLLGRLVRNLTDNAARHARTTVAFAVSERDGTTTLTVDDDGPGVPPAERERVFERFVRLDEGRARDAGGSGLGLAIVRGIAESSGGTVAVEDAPIGGARFVVRFPSAS